MARIEAVLVAAFVEKGISRGDVHLKARPTGHGQVRVLGRVGARPYDVVLACRLRRELATLRHTDAVVAK